LVSKKLLLCTAYTYATPVYKEIWVSPNITIVTSGNLCQSLSLEKIFDVESLEVTNFGLIKILPRHIDHLQVGKPSWYVMASQANSVSFIQCDGRWVPAKGQWCWGL